MVTRRFTIIGLRFIGLALNVGRFALRAKGLTVFAVRLGLTFIVCRVGLPTDRRLNALTLEVVLEVRAFVRDMLFRDVDFLPLDLRPLLERPLLDLLLERPRLLDFPRELERPRLLERPRERPPRLANFFTPR